MDEYRQHLPNELPQIAIEFFALFSCFEFALKRGGFLSGDINRKARADWDGFATALGPGFFAAMQAAPEARIFFDERPKRLDRISDEDVAFREPAPIVNGQLLFEAVRLVRNNFFHGEKANVGPRDQSLMTAGLFILDSAMAACDQVHDCRKIPAAFVFAVLPAAN